MEWPPFKQTGTKSNGTTIWEVQVQSDPGTTPTRSAHYYRHPSFGMIQVCRWQGGTKNRLFQTNVDVQAGISIRISRAELRRDLSMDFLHPYGSIVEVNLSPAQFSDLLVNMNTIGVPCTISMYREGPNKVVCPVYPENFDNELNRIEEEFKEAIRKLEISSPEDEALLKEIADRLPKKEQARLFGLISNIRARVKGHIPFLRDQFEESISRTMTQAKNEFASYVVHATGKSQETLSEAPSPLKFLDIHTKEDPDGLDR